MATKYCVNCEQVIEAKRVIGVGTFIMAIISGGAWLLVIPLYSKRCPICKGTNFGSKPVDKVGIKQSDAQTAIKEKLEKLQGLKDSGIITEEEFNAQRKNIIASL